MKKSNHNHLTVTMIVALAFATMISMGCSNSPLNTDATIGDSPQPNLLARSASKVAASSFSASDLSVEQVIFDATGGRLELLDVILEIPAGAVGQDTTFSINIPDPYVFFNEFGTDGLVFHTPVRVTMSYRDADLTGVTESTIRIGWLDESSGTFKDMVCEVDFINKTVTAELNHFSAYGLISD